MVITESHEPYEFRCVSKTTRA